MAPPAEVVAEEIGLIGVLTRRLSCRACRTAAMAKRFTQTSLREWAYARAYSSSAERAQATQPEIASYNHRRPRPPSADRPPPHD